MSKHRAAFLVANPEWVEIPQGFDVHHIDGDHSNNDPANLCLMDHVSHMRLHGVDLRAEAKRGPRTPKPSAPRRQYARLIKALRADPVYGKVLT